MLDLYTSSRGCWGHIPTSWAQAFFHWATGVLNHNLTVSTSDHTRHFSNQCDSHQVAKVVCENGPDNHCSLSDTWPPYYYQTCTSKHPAPLPTDTHTHTHTHILSLSLNVFFLLFLFFFTLHFCCCCCCYCCCLFVCFVFCFSSFNFFKALTEIG